MLKCEGFFLLVWSPDGPKTLAAVASEALTAAADLIFS